MILNQRRKERIEREKREAKQAKAAAELAEAAMTKGSDILETMRAKGAAGKDAVKQHGKAVMEASGPLLSLVKGFVQNRAAAAGKKYAEYQAEKAERQKQEKIEFDAKKRLNNATRKVQTKWRDKKRMRIERSEKARQIRDARNYILKQLEEIEGFNTQIREKMRQLKNIVPYERWLAYINELKFHENRARIRGRPNTDPPRPEQNLVNWAKRQHGNLNLSGLITKIITTRPPISRSEVESEIEQMKKLQKNKPSLKRKLHKLNEAYKMLFI